MISLEEEVRRGYTISKEMKKVWSVQLCLLNKLLSVCQEHNLKIWADGGTLLGTVREHGYIPWDDDIDMAMLREDYDKLVSIAPSVFKEPFFFQCGYTDIFYSSGYSRLRMDGTTAITNAIKSPRVLDNHLGIFIDIFPYDVIPDDEDKKQSLLKKRMKYINKVNRVGRFDILHPIRSIMLIKYLSCFSKLFGEYEQIYRENSIKDNSNIACLSFIEDFEHFLRDKHWYDNTEYMPFEDVLMPVPSGYNEILTKQYGDYMKPVMQPAYHTYWKLDPEKSYKEYLPEYKNKVRKFWLHSYYNRLTKLFQRVFTKDLI